VTDIYWPTSYDILEYPTG